MMRWSLDTVRKDIMVVFLGLPIGIFLAASLYAVLKIVSSSELIYFGVPFIALFLYLILLVFLRDRWTQWLLQSLSKSTDPNYRILSKMMTVRDHPVVVVWTDDALIANILESSVLPLIKQQLTASAMDVVVVTIRITARRKLEITFYDSHQKKIHRETTPVDLSTSSMTTREQEKQARRRQEQSSLKELGFREWRLGEEMSR